MNENTGGYAFPSEQGTDEYGRWNDAWEGGMTLRDYFAGQALAGIAATSAEPNCPSVEDMAKMSYTLADAMLKARDEQ